jgi:MFS family permease
MFYNLVCLLDKKYPEEVCYNMTHGLSLDNDTYLEEVQKTVTDLEIYDGILVALPSVIFCLFLGAWSDTHGRKYILVLPFVGNFVAFVAYMINYAFFDELGIYHLLWGSTVGMFGGYIGLNIALYGYIGNILFISHLNN